jgi:hypothetical protein
VDIQLHRTVIHFHTHFTTLALPKHEQHEQFELVGTKVGGVGVVCSVALIGVVGGCLR